MDCSPPGSSVRFSRQEYGSGLPFPFSRGSSWPRDWMQVPSLQADSLPSKQLGKHIERPPKSLDLGRVPSLSGSHFFFLSFYSGYNHRFHDVVAKINGITSHMRILKNACSIRKQRMLQPLHYSRWVVSPEGTQDTNRRPTPRPSATAATPCWRTLRRLKMRKHKVLRYVSEEWYQWAQTLAPSHT